MRSVFQESFLGKLFLDEEARFGTGELFLSHI
jgi:hypothetical protein